MLKEGRRLRKKAGMIVVLYWCPSMHSDGKGFAQMLLI
jgi:hypothetical protein